MMGRLAPIAGHSGQPDMMLRASNGEEGVDQLATVSSSVTPPTGGAVFDICNVQCVIVPTPLYIIVPYKCQSDTIEVFCNVLQRTCWSSEQILQLYVAFL